MYEKSKMGRINRLDPYNVNFLLYMEKYYIVGIISLLGLNLFILYKMWPLLVVYYYMISFAYF